MIAISQITIRDMNDIITSSNSPTEAIKDQMWLDTSLNPSVLKRFNGEHWDIVNDYTKPINEIKDNVKENSTDIKTHEIKTNILEQNLNSLTQIVENNKTTVDGNIKSIENTTHELKIGLSGLTKKVSSSEVKINQVDGKISNLVTKEEVAKIEISTQNINAEMSKKINGDNIISKINLSPEALKIDADKIELNGYVTFTSLQSSGGTIVNADNIRTGTIKSVNIESCYFRGKNIVYIEEGGVFSCDGDGYIKYIRCDEAWMTSPYSTGWKVPLIHSKFGIKDNQSSSDMIDEVAFYRGTDGRNYLQITNTKTGRVEYIELYTTNNDTKTILNKINGIEKEIQTLKNK
ncbi:hypothetical protein ACSXDM_15045 (plasmid) [Clostridium perfringens]|uniref:hypothetical protein n=1 Tax=Clostridium perfringens TaxID=1502 RepID=UPI0013E387DF|nr:hypothetical protein [Clostridium perfringens]NGS95816.1 hypothetical protein [Clostridium perfringens]